MCSAVTVPKSLPETCLGRTCPKLSSSAMFPHERNVNTAALGLAKLGLSWPDRLG